MIEIHRANERGVTKESWLTSHHSFAFNTWFRPDRICFGKLRVLNDDMIAPGRGFGTHGHTNMEIVTIPLNGAVKHQDNAGGSGIIKAGEVQRMSAGTGVAHSEFNASATQPLHLLQIWIEPKQLNIPPSYEQAAVHLTKNNFITIVDGTHSKKVGEILYIHQNSKFLLGEFDEGKEIKYSLEKTYGAYLFIIAGKIELPGQQMQAGDAALLTEPLSAKSLTPAKILLIMVPA
jgi:quercetin 2,3-dioxygenase